MTKKKIVLHVVIGFIVGAAVGILISLFSALANGDKLMEHTAVAQKVGRAGAIALQIFVSGLLGCACVSGMLLYEIEKWSLALATVVHFLVIIVGFTVASFSMGWFSDNLAYYFIAVACNAAGFVVIWVIMYLLWKREVKKMNEELKKYREDEEKDERN